MSGKLLGSSPGQAEARKSRTNPSILGITFKKDAIQVSFCFEFCFVLFLSPVLFATSEK